MPPSTCGMSSGAVLRRSAKAQCKSVIADEHRCCMEMRAMASLMTLFITARHWHKLKTGRDQFHMGAMTAQHAALRRKLTAPHWYIRQKSTAIYVEFWKNKLAAAYESDSGIYKLADDNAL